MPTAVLRAHDARCTVPPLYSRTGPPPAGLGQTGQPWWTVMQDFVPYALLKVCAPVCPFFHLQVSSTGARQQLVGIEQTCASASGGHGPSQRELRIRAL